MIEDKPSKMIEDKPSKMIEDKPRRLTRKRLRAIIEALSCRLAGPIDDTNTHHDDYTNALLWAQQEMERRFPK